MLLYHIQQFFIIPNKTDEFLTFLVIYFHNKTDKNCSPKTTYKSIFLSLSIIFILFTCINNKNYVKSLFFFYSKTVWWNFLSKNIYLHSLITLFKKLVFFSRNRNFLSGFLTRRACSKRIWPLAIFVIKHSNVESLKLELTRHHYW